jgi:hypothetical protein
MVASTVLSASRGVQSERDLPHVKYRTGCCKYQPFYGHDSHSTSEHGATGTSSGEKISCTSPMAWIEETFTTVWLIPFSWFMRWGVNPTCMLV